MLMLFAPIDVGWKATLNVHFPLEGISVALEHVSFVIWNSVVSPATDMAPGVRVVTPLVVLFITVITAGFVLLFTFKFPKFLLLGANTRVGNFMKSACTLLAPFMETTQEVFVVHAPAPAPSHF